VSNLPLISPLERDGKERRRGEAGVVLRQGAGEEDLGREVDADLHLDRVGVTRPAASLRGLPSGGAKTFGGFSWEAQNKSI
jgi:hypothetical protein